MPFHSQFYPPVEIGLPTALLPRSGSKPRQTSLATWTPNLRALPVPLAAPLPRSAARENKSSRNLTIQPCAPQIISDEGEQFLCARFNNLGKRVSKNPSRRAVSYAGDFDRAVIAHERSGSTPMMPLDSLRLWNRGE